MSHWTIKHTIGTVISVVVTAALSGLGWMVWNVLKVPDHDALLKKHGDQLTTISVNILTLMQKTGHPPSQEDYEKLLPVVFQMGSTKAELIRSAEVVRGTGAIPLANWVPAGYGPTADMFAFVGEGATVKDKEQIARIIFGATLADKPVSWSVADRKLRLRYEPNNVIALTPDKSISDNDLKAWAASLNQINADFKEVAGANATNR